MKDHYSYQETLEIAEKFMTDTGIREYCETICKGKCCGKCYDSPDACSKNEGRRLPCSMFICSQLRRHLNQRIRDVWYGVAVAIESKVESFMGKKSCYFNVNTPEIQKAFKIQKSVVDNLTSKTGSIKTINKTMKELIDNKIQVRG